MEEDSVERTAAQQLQTRCRLVTAAAKRVAHSAEEVSPAWSNRLLALRHNLFKSDMNRPEDVLDALVTLSMWSEEAPSGTDIAELSALIDAAVYLAETDDQAAGLGVGGTAQQSDIATALNEPKGELGKIQQTSVDVLSSGVLITSALPSMQYHHHGYVAHDPRIKEAAGTGIDRPDELPDEMDLLIVGAGPSGIVQAAQLTNYPNIHTRIIESRPGRLEIGRADGLWSRSSETFQAFEFYERIAAEAQLLGDVCFWGPNPDDPTKIVRAVRAVDPPAGVSEFPLMIVNQARVIDYFAEYAANGPAKINLDYGYEFLDLIVEESGEYPVKARVLDPQGKERTVSAKYVVGCDGKRSRVRDCTDIEVSFHPAAQAWAVMDLLARTDFPDARRHCGIQSDKDGSILLIPREGGFLVRYYVSLGYVDDNNRDQIFATKVEEAIERANQILQPYTLDVEKVTWYSVYETRHTVATKFDDVPLDQVGERVPRVFIAGDACHTHSAQAGQGMNMSIQDGWNLAWKLGQVLEGRSDPSLLSTYSAERQLMAQNLIGFDQEYSTILSKRPEEFDGLQDIGDFYVKTVEFPAGFMTQYPPSTIIGENNHQDLAKGLPIGKRFESALATRVADTRARHLGHHFRADGRWRLYAFADADGTAVAELADWLENSDDSPVAQFTPEGTDVDSVFDANVIYQHPYADIELDQIPRYFLPQVGPYALVNYEKVYAAIGADNIFETLGIDRSGALVIQRPDMYIAHVLPLSAREEITQFFARHMMQQRSEVSRLATAKT